MILVLEKLTLKALRYRNLIFYSLEAVSRYRDTQLEVGKNYFVQFETNQLQILMFKHLFHSH